MIDETVWGVEFFSTRADPNVWIWSAIKTDGFEYYDMVLCYIYGVIFISATLMVAIYGIRYVFKLKGDTAKVPGMYLGPGVAKIVTASGTKCWTLSSEKYIRTAVANV